MHKNLDILTIPLRSLKAQSNEKLEGQTKLEAWKSAWKGWQSALLSYWQASSYLTKRSCWWRCQQFAQVKTWIFDEIDFRRISTCDQFLWLSDLHRLDAEWRSRNDLQNSAACRFIRLPQLVIIMDFLNKLVQRFLHSLWFWPGHRAFHSFQRIFMF